MTSSSNENDVFRPNCSRRRRWLRAATSSPTPYQRNALSPQPYVRSLACPAPTEVTSSLGKGQCLVNQSRHSSRGSYPGTPLASRSPMVTIVRPVHGRVEIHGMRRPGPGQPANRQWLKDVLGDRIRPTWVPGPQGWDGYWTISREHFDEVTRALAIRLGQVDIDLHYSQLQKCDTRCQAARGTDCVCECMGENHGVGAHASWTQVGDTTLIARDVVGVRRRVTRADVHRLPSP